MAQLGIKYWLDAGATGIAYFNVSLADNTTLFAGNYNRLTDVEGLDFPTLRTSVVPRAVSDGDLLMPSWRAARYVSLEGMLIATGATEAAAIAQRESQEDFLRKILNALVRTDGTLRWTRRDGVTRQMVCRVWEPMRVRPAGPMKTFLMQLVAPDPYVYNDTQTQTTDSTPTTAQTFTNNGDAESYPVIRVTNGATAIASAFTLTNSTTGKSIVISGASMATSGFFDIDMANRTIVNNTGASQLAFVNWSSSTFWPLVPGGNSVVISGVTGGPLASTRVTYRDTWIGG
jgi:hypothetical protein